MANGPNAAAKPQRRFQFIDNSNVGSSSQNSTQVRRHVMQEYMREKRWEARSKAESSVFSQAAQPQTQQEAQSVARLPTSKPIFQRRRESKHNSSNADTPGARPTSIIVGQPEQYPVIVYQGEHAWDSTAQPELASHLLSSRKSFNLDAKSFAALADMFPLEAPSPAHTISSGRSWSPPRVGTESRLSPLSVLSAARTDPFDVLPITLGLKDKELFDFYAVVMPSCSYGFERKHHKAHNWYRDVFIPEAMKGPVTFKNTILVHAANTQAWVQGLDESPLALEYRNLAISALHQHYAKYPDDTSDEVITATMSAAALEDFDPRPERKPIAWIHWSAAMHKIRLAGGPAQLEYKPSLRKLVNWQDYIFSGYDGRGSTFYFTPEAAFNSRDDVAKEAFGRQEIAGQCEEFLIFLKCAEHLAAVAASQMHKPTALQGQPLRYSVFAQDHPLYVLLASPNKERYTQTGQLKQIISRLGSLMTINVAIWEYRYNLSHSEAFFDELVKNIYYNELDKNISVEALMQILLSGSENPHLQASERPWLVGRLLKVAKRLSRSSWERLNDFLLSCLTLKGPLGSQMQQWEAQLRHEIMQAPLVSHKLPLMQT